ncbi:hypothetical protein EV667_3349 [Ancylobacter aquaticus]|uniref:Uncharacterized protein n=1 Tax=Ancylobacter aquaticus TaxID=100 RepID=A0A4R1HQQ5_ANCAQ|nr:hypothetical protein [Ancylobacter aquaticus]TCK23513.1 hypothetical protein EV667_3349 [Ancylobacter aquaticus]
MKEQYVGDISDYRKYALLRALAASGTNRMGVCWMLTAPDGRADGGKLAYLQQPERYRAFDPDLFDMLAHVAAEPDRRRLGSIEASEAVPGATYFNAAMSDDLLGRSAYMAACQSALATAELIFFDPDNGLEVALRKGRKGSSKFLYLDEVATFYAAGKSLLVYQHFPRVEREAFIQDCAARLRGVAPDADLWAFRTAHVVFLLLLHPSSPPSLVKAGRAACNRWPSDFVRGYPVSSPPSDPLAQLLVELEGDAASGRG